MNGSIFVRLPQRFRGIDTMPRCFALVRNLFSCGAEDLCSWGLFISARSSLLAVSFSYLSFFQATFLRSLIGLRHPSDVRALLTVRITSVISADLHFLVAYPSDAQTCTCKHDDYGSSRPDSSFVLFVRHLWRPLYGISWRDGVRC